MVLIKVIARKASGCSAVLQKKIVTALKTFIPGIYAMKHRSELNESTGKRQWLMYTILCTTPRCTITKGKDGMDTAVTLWDVPGTVTIQLLLQDLHRTSITFRFAGPA